MLAFRYNTLISYIENNLHRHNTDTPHKNMDRWTDNYRLFDSTGQTLEYLFLYSHDTGAELLATRLQSSQFMTQLFLQKLATLNQLLGHESTPFTKLQNCECICSAITVRVETWPFLVTSFAERAYESLYNSWLNPLSRSNDSWIKSTKFMIRFLRPSVSLETPLGPQSTRLNRSSKF